MVAMKATARCYRRRPKHNEEIELNVISCEMCQTARKAPPVAPLHPCKWSTRARQRLHTDFAKKDGENFLLVIDSHSKWVVFKHTNPTTAQKTTEVLRTLFSAMVFLTKLFPITDHSLSQKNLHS